MLACRGRLIWVMLNPSTADDKADDATMTRVIGFTRSEQFERLEVVNLFAARTTMPRGLHGPNAGDVVGPGNDDWIAGAFARADAVVFAWGAHRHPLKAGRVAFVVDTAVAYGLDPLCLGVTGDGSPCHPLYLKATAHLRPWARARALAGGHRGE